MNLKCFQLKILSIVKLFVFTVIAILFNFRKKISQLLHFKKFIISKVFYFFLIPVLTYSQTNWEKLNSPTTVLLRNIISVDANHAWAAGRIGTIVRTTNGGDDWTILNTGVTDFIYDVFFIDQQFGWAVSFPTTPPYFTRILKTSDGGNNWSISTFPEEFTFFRTVFFHDSLNGFLGGDYIAKTTNGGLTWEKTNIDSNLISNYPIINFKFYNKDFGFACGGFIDQAGVIWRTIDGGSNWVAEGVSPDEVFDMHLKDSLNAITLSGDPELFFRTGIIKTANSGLNWSYREADFYALSFAIDFQDSLQGWSASGYNFFHTNDGGENWHFIPTPDSAGIFGLDFSDEFTGFACGIDGVLLRYKIPKFIQPPIDSSKSHLRQNFPNPFSSQTNIQYYIKAPSIVKIKLYDVIGNQVLTLVDESKTEGIYTLNINGSIFSSGIYFCQLVAADNSSTIKLVLAK